MYDTSHIYGTVEQLETEITRSQSRVGRELNQGTLIERLAEATDIVDRTTSRIFRMEEDHTYSVDCLAPEVDGRSLLLPSDLCEIASITNGDGTVIDIENDIITTPRQSRVVNGRVKTLGRPDDWPFHEIVLKLNSTSSNIWTWSDEPYGAIQITGRWAFSVSPPAPIIAGTLRLAAMLYLDREIGAEVQRMVADIRSGGFIPSGTPDSVLKRILRYKRYV